MPRSVQQSIPIDRIYADGVWQSGNVFSMMWQISDINYAMQSDAAKQNILTQLGTVYAGIPADCWMQVCIVSQRMDEKAFARDVLYHRENDGFDALRAERNRQIKANARENGNVVQHKYIIVSTNKPGVKEARERFVQVQGHPMSENEIRVLYVQPGKYPEERTIPNTLRALQELVGGDIECCRPWRDSVCVICNDSGKIDGLPPNRLYRHTDFLAGSFVVCGNGGEDFISLTDRQVFLYERLYHNPVVFLPTPHGLLPMKCTPEQYEQFQRDGNKLKIKPIDHGER